MCKVSILIPIYNVEKYLNQCLESVINQTLKDIEIICINDGSTDHSLEIINDFAKKDNRIKVINKPNTGYGHSMNQGLKLAKGEYIGIIESDDYADLNMFETLYNKAEKSQAEVIKSNFWKQHGDIITFTEYLKGASIYEKNFTPVRDQIIFCIPIWNSLYKRKFLIENDIYFNETPGASYQDVAFGFKTFACAKNVYFVKEAFLHYRVDNPNSSVKSKEKVYCIFDEFKEIERFLTKREDLQDPYRCIVEPLKYVNYIWHYKRISDKFKFDFLKRVYDEFDQDRISGYLDKTYWKEKHWQGIQNMLNNKKEFFYRQYEKDQNKQIYLEGIFSIIKNFKKIYIYGAGIVADSLLQNLIKRNLNVAGIVVSNLKNNPNKFRGIQVVAFSDAIIDKEQDCIFIAMKELSQYEILYKLQEEGYKNIFVVTKTFLIALGQVI